MAENGPRLPLVGWITCGLLLLCLVAGMLATGEYLPKLGLDQPYFPTYLKFYISQTIAALAAVAGAAWLAGLPRGVGKPKWRSVLRRHAFPVALGLYAAWALLTCTWATWRYGTVGYVMREMWMYFMCVACYAAFASRRRMVVFSVVFGLAAVAATEWQLVELLVRYFGADGRTPLRKLFLQRPFLYGNLNFSCSQTICSALVALALGMWCVRALLKGPRAAGRIALLALGVLACVVAVAVSMVFVKLVGSLGGYLAAGLASGAYFVCMMPLGRYRRHVAVLLALLAALGACLYAPRIVADLNDPTTTVYARGRAWWPATARMFAERPLRGWGMGAYPSAYYRHAPQAADMSAVTRNVQATHPHNEPLRVAAEQGLVGLAFYLAVMGIPLVAAYRRLRQLEFGARAVGFAMWAAALAYLLQASVGKAAMSWDFAVPFWMLLGVLAAMSHWPGMEADEAKAGAAPAPWRAGVLVWVITVLAALASFILWQQWAYRGYDSMLWLREAKKALFRGRSSYQRMLQQPPARQAEARRAKEWMPFLKRCQDSAKQARKGCLWPVRVLKYEYMAPLMLVQVGEYGEALPAFRHVHEQAPGCLEVERLMGKSYLMLAAEQYKAGNLEEGAKLRERAVHFLREQIERHPFQTNAYRDLARSKLDLDLAHELLADQVTKRDKFADADRISLLRRLLMYRENWQGLAALIDQVEQAGHVDPVKVGLVQTLGAHYRQADPAKFRILLERYPKAFPDQKGGKTTGGR